MKLLIILILSLSFNTLAKKKSILIIDQPSVLQKLEINGFSFPSILTNNQSHHTKNSELIKNKKYRSIIQTIEKDLDLLKNGDKYLSVTMAKKHRLFDKRWFSSKHSFYELAGVITRLDRAPFEENSLHSCGEIRLIYRLAYRKKKNNEEIYTRLPVTLNVVYWAKDLKTNSSDCHKVANQWTYQSSPFNQVLENKKQFKLEHLKSIEINFQAIRWPSSVRPDFGGYAEYIMRVFKLNRNVFKPSLMENMLDTVKLKNNSKLKKELLSYLSQKEIIQKFDMGIGTIPEKFLADKATSVAFHGMARLKNRPFDQVFTEKDFQGIDFTEKKFIQTPFAYLRRLNDMSCVGCHQGRAIAGFHFVGVDRKETHQANSVMMARSGHLQLDLKRRKKYMEELLSGKIPSSIRGFSERLENEVGKYGAHCTLGKDKSFKQWSCESGLKCQSIDSATSNNKIGVCLPLKNMFSGDPCDIGRVSQDPNGRKDRVIQKTSRACRSDQYCFTSSAGFPGGLCHEYCENIQQGERCGVIAFNGFNGCLASNTPFTKCLKDFTGNISLKSCDLNNPCRDDFICASNGTCLPPYFLFQLRADGHLSPL